MDLSDDDKALIADHRARGKPLPDRFRWTMFREPREAELIWPGKTSDVTNVVLPFQSIEQIDEPRSETGAQVADLFQIGGGGRQGGGWSDKLIWGDNKLVLSSLKGSGRTPVFSPGLKAGTPAQQGLTTYRQKGCASFIGGLSGGPLNRQMQSCP